MTIWEVFTGGSVPYAGVPALTLLRELSSGHRLARPSNDVCSDEMYIYMYMYTVISCNYCIIAYIIYAILFYILNYGFCFQS